MLPRHISVAFFTWYTSLLVVITCNDYKGFDDSVLYKINWPGADINPLADDLETIDITTHQSEKYRCTLPNDKLSNDPKDAVYNGPTPFELVSTLFSAATCSYRIESYWTYEVCHGSYIKQFHEERDGSIVRLQEYHLGKWDKEQTVDMTNEAKELEALKKSEKFKTIRIDGVNLPYLEVEMGGGTMCDLNGQPRMTTVQYVCYPHGKNEVYSLKEVSTCSYEVVILTPTLCIHPSFNPKEANDNTISCVPLSNAPPKPRSLLMQEAENMRKILDGTVKSEVLSDNFLTKSLKDAVDASIPGKDIETAAGADTIPVKTASKAIDITQMLNFLDGKHCLTGGGGWWKYEFCYGRYVRQFHIDKNGETSLVLGNFDEQAHKDWLNENPQKRPRKSVRHVSHLYQGGSKCDETGELRQTEVQLRCLENSTSKSKVSLFLMEPKTCHYILGIESQFLCDIVDAADEHGLIQLDSFKELHDEEIMTVETIQDNDEDVQETIDNMFN